MNWRTILFSALLGITALSHSALAQISFSNSKSTTEKLGGNAASDEKTQVEILANTSAIVPGKSFQIAVTFKHPKGWHSYYRNSGGLELPPRFSWKNLPDGLTIDEPTWPTPQVSEGFFGKSFLLPAEASFLFTVEVSDKLALDQTIPFSLDAQWQICKETCRDESGTFSLNLPVKATANEAHAERFRVISLAQPLKRRDVAITTEAFPDRIEIRIVPTQGEKFPDLGSAKNLDFIPDQPYLHALSDGGKIENTGGNHYQITLKRATKNALDKPIKQGNSVTGILRADSPLADSGHLARLINHADGVVTRSTPLAWSKIFPVLGFMLIGGFILNLMPCVFPVIGLKIMGFVEQAGSSRRHIILHGLTFALGVLVSFWALSGTLFALRSLALRNGASADSIGWGYQLQNPYVVLALLLLMLLMAMNLFGVFEIGTKATSIGGSLQNQSGFRGSFFSGILATIVATPCSAPFLGSAIGAAIGFPAIPFFLAFTCMALGLATPYFVLSCFPALIEKLPRPGAWMVSFKQAMSFFLFATAGYFLWIYAALIRLENLLFPIIGLTVIALAAWVYGRWFQPHLSRSSRTKTLIVTALLAVFGLFLAAPPKQPQLDWQPWSDQAVQSALEQDRPVYVDFTATWCATCQVNKKRAYTPEVEALFKNRNILTLRADKTQATPAIEEKLRELGRSAIPVNVLYLPGKDPIITPEILSADYLKQLITTEIPAP